ncbi:putative xylulose kinase [Pseudonocardia sp. Ae717_Ps2]|uniref:xylulokinase n=1 Tax=Pseudonocardia sp. Ae717_Ps2 TaxID=1885573 RepID=UPI00094B1252|nr:FGGY family carbohydrate kinase [Pseudonocardia sp. Ae717_Ps2]OLM28571.1 putative xylulose kinase [Pseudonocardia sp. Ae717_Ps2]
MVRSTGSGQPASLGIDLGTSSVKAIVTGLDGTVIGHAAVPYPVLAPRPGWSETDPEAWLSATAAAVRTAVAEVGARPVAIGLSGQMHGLVLAKADGRPIRHAMLWSDARAVRELATYRNLPERVRAQLANPLSPGMPGPMLAWLNTHEPDALSATRWALQPKDWLRAQLTGRFATEPSDASATLLYNIPADDWSTEIVEALGLDPARLPPVLPDSAHPAGELTSDAAHLLELPPGLPVVAGAADTAAAALGSGLAHSSAVQLTIGTGVQVVRSVPALPEHLPVTPNTHLFRAATPKGWYAMGAGLNGGSTLAWVCRTLNASWQELYDVAARPPREHDPYFLPHLHGERTPHLDPDMRGAWIGLAPQHDREHLLRAALEGVGFAARDILDAILATGPPLSELWLAGGGTTDPRWRQMLADAVARPLHPVDVAAASGLGAAILAAQAAETAHGAAGRERHSAPVAPAVEPESTNSEIYSVRYTRYRDQARALPRASAIMPGAQTGD